MKRRTSTNHYNTRSSTTTTNTDDIATSKKSKNERSSFEKLDEEADTIAATKSEVTNTTSIGKLYTNGLSDSKTKTTVGHFYLGTCKYEIIKVINPLLSFNDYFSAITNDMYGYLQNENIHAYMLQNNPEKVLVHLFLSILNYNNIVIPENITMVVHDTPMVLGECMYYDKSYDYDKLVVHIISPLVARFLHTNDIHDITFSAAINRDIFSIKDNVSAYAQELLVTEEVTSIITKLIVIADHAATHFIEDYTLNQTDWIHHVAFGKNIHRHTLLGTIFNIAASINVIESNPKIIIETTSGPSTEGLTLIERIMNSDFTNILPITPLNDITL
nr:hypothetical protein MmNV_51 [Menippe mercenaria nudivirus]